MNAGRHAARKFSRISSHLASLNLLLAPQSSYTDLQIPFSGLVSENGDSSCFEPNSLRLLSYLLYPR